MSNDKMTPLWAPPNFWELPEDERRRLIDEECGPHAELDRPPKWARDDFWYCHADERQRLARRYRNKSLGERIELFFETPADIDWHSIEGVGDKAAQSLEAATRECRSMSDLKRWLATTDLTKIEHIGPKNGENVRNHLELIFMMEDI